MTFQETREEVEMLCEEMNSMLKRAKRGFIAPLKCVEAVKTAALTEFEEGMKIEQQYSSPRVLRCIQTALRLIMELMATPDAAAQQYFFFAEREAAKLVPQITQKHPAILPVSC